MLFTPDEKDNSDLPESGSNENRQTPTNEEPKKPSIPDMPEIPDNTEIPETPELPKENDNTPAQSPIPPEEIPDASLSQSYTPQNAEQQKPSQPVQPVQPDYHQSNTPYYMSSQQPNQPNDPQRPQKPKLSKGSKVFIGCMIALASLILFGTVAFVGISLLDNALGTTSSQITSSTASGDVTPGITLTDLIKLEKTGNETKSTIEVAAKIRPSVVGITAYKLSSIDPLGEGSGIVFTQDGYIVTNAHVVAEGNRFIVTTSDNKTYDAEVIATSTLDDLAVIKINASGLTPAEFGDSNSLQIGQFVMTSGNPGGSQFAGSVTIGVVSGVKRTNSVSDYTSFIQTDAAINPGNSGGALVNMSGQVIGINSAKISGVDYEGIGFAIPSSEATPIINDLIKYGYVKNRVRVGIEIEDITPSVAAANKIPAGVIVKNVTNPEVTKLLAQGDIITNLNGEAITTVDQLIGLVRSHKVGETVTLSVYRVRGGVVSRFDIKVALIEDRGDLS